MSGSAAPDDRRLRIESGPLDGRWWMVLRGEIGRGGSHRLAAALDDARASVCNRLIADLRTAVATDAALTDVLTLLSDHQTEDARWRVVATTETCDFAATHDVGGLVLGTGADLDATRCPAGGAAAQPRMTGCRACGQVWGPRTAPPRCPSCGTACFRMDMPEIAALVLRRQRLLRGARRDRPGQPATTSA